MSCKIFRISQASGHCGGEELIATVPTLAAAQTHIGAVTLRPTGGGEYRGTDVVRGFEYHIVES